MNINYDVPKEKVFPSRKLKMSEEIAAIMEFAETDHENIQFEYETEDLARRRRNNIAVNMRKRGLEFQALLRGNCVIVVKKPAKTGKK